MHHLSLVCRVYASGLVLLYLHVTSCYQRCQHELINVLLQCCLLQKDGPNVKHQQHTVCDALTPHYQKCGVASTLWDVF